MEKENEDFSYIVTHLVDPVFCHTEKVDTCLLFLLFYRKRKSQALKKGTTVFLIKPMLLLYVKVWKGPGNIAMPDIRLLNVMYRELVQSAQLANRPPMFYDDGYLLLSLCTCGDKL